MWKASDVPASPEGTVTDDAFELLLVTGMSGAGRSTAARALEDLGWFVVDNLPPALLPQAVEEVKSDQESERLAVVVDARGGTRLGVMTEDGTRLLCDSHGATYRPSDGRCVFGPCEGTSLHSFEVERSGDRLALIWRGDGDGNCVGKLQQPDAVFSGKDFLFALPHSRGCRCENS